MNHLHQYRVLERDKQNKRLLESRLLLRAFQRLCEQWDLSRKEGFELLGLNSLHQLSSWQSGTIDTLLTDLQIERLSFLLSIQQIISRQLTDQPSLIKWLREPKSLDSLDLDSNLASKSAISPLEVFRIANKQQMRQITQKLSDADPALFFIHSIAQESASNCIRF
jgi:hypothetical protein